MHTASDNTTVITKKVCTREILPLVFFYIICATKLCVKHLSVT